MVAVVSGTGLGLFGSSASALGQAGATGSSGVGRGNDRVYVNTATGNLVVQSQDERLSALGLDVAVVRTYNSQGLFDDDNGDNWRLNIGRVQLTGNTVTKVFGDGREVLYHFDAGRGLYVSAEGDGAHDTLTYSGSQWTWRDGSSQVTETYNSQGRLTSSQDADGNALTYTYAGSLLSRITSAPGEFTEFIYSGSNLTEVRVVSAGQTQTLTRYQYDASNRLQSVQLDLSPEDNSVLDGRVYTTTYTYDGTSKRIQSLTQSDGSSVTFTYELIAGQHRITSYTDGEGRVTQLTYSQSSGGSGVTIPANTGVLSTTETQQQTNTHNLNSGALTTPSGGWQSVTSFESSATEVDLPKIAFDASGNGFAIWDEGDNVQMRRYDKASNTWSAPVALDSGSAAVGGLSLAVDAAGNAIAAWVQSDGTRNSLYVNRYTASTQSWSGAQLLESSDLAVATTFDGTAVAINGSHAVALWLQTDGTQNNLFAAARFNGSSWSAPELIEANNNAASKPSVAIDGEGNISAIWRQSDGTADNAYVNRYSVASGVWGGATLFDGSTGFVLDPEIAFDANGNGIAVWRAGSWMVARHFNKASNTWGAEVQLDSSTQTVYSSNFSMDADGNAIVAWVQSAASGDPRSVYARRYDASTQSWGALQLLESSALAADTAGNVAVSIRGAFAVVTWLQTDGTRNDLYAARLNGSTWSAPEYETPGGGWTEYDVHHIRPREFGGGNDFWNLTPIPRQTHPGFNDFWMHY